MRLLLYYKETQFISPYPLSIGPYKKYFDEMMKSCSCAHISLISPHVKTLGNHFIKLNHSLFEDFIKMNILGDIDIYEYVND